MSPLCCSSLLLILRLILFLIFLPSRWSTKEYGASVGFARRWHQGLAIGELRPRCRAATFRRGAAGGCWSIFRCWGALEDLGTSGRMVLHHWFSMCFWYFVWYSDNRKARQIYETQQCEDAKVCIPAHLHRGGRRICPISVEAKIESHPAGVWHVVPLETSLKPLGNPLWFPSKWLRHIQTFTMLLRSLECDFGWLMGQFMGVMGHCQMDLVLRKSFWNN